MSSSVGVAPYTTQATPVTQQVQPSTPSTASVSPQGAQSLAAAEPWKQLRCIGIPVFSGDKRKFDSWRSAFMACIDSAPATAEFKMLQLRQYLSGEALAAIDSFGYSAAAYDAVKALLERKYGG